ncbi:uncharacterized protein LOC133907937 [Phragmites australis]|uniref:uncharacterized protein LOC133907937 n=1 Tax=Phragmites australis TaxID=29695 RepID=UPI002D79668B|nr:uncharacterized protein LOC133907937 [Phragmites australis]
MVAEAAPSSSAAIWSHRRDEITFDRLHKFWSALSPHARHELLRLDKQTLIEHARKNLYCSRCNGLLLESFTQIVMYGKSLHQEGSGEPKIQEVESEEVQDPSVHPWGGLSTTKDSILTLDDCFINAKSLHVLQNVFDNARAREHEREMFYPDACGGGGRGWISPVIPNYGRGHGTRDTCALHTARLSCDTLVDFWSALGEETKSSLLRMKEEDFIERLMHRFDRKRFCRDCRRNVIREFKELKELKRMRREPRCTSWFCVADTAFKCEVFEDAVLVDWHQSLLEQDGSYHHFEWAIGTGEGKSDILDFEDVGMNGQVHRKGLDLDQFEDYFVTLRAWRLDGRCTEFCVKAHALKGQSCVHRRLIVGDGLVTIMKRESIRGFFEHAEEAEEEDEDDAIDRDGNDPDSDATHPQKHAKSPELAREFLLDAAAVIFKEQVEKAFREGTARQNAHSVFVSLALKLLEERVHVACKEIITLEKQTKLLEEEEKEKREEEERRERRRTKEREKKHRRKERLKGKERDKEKSLVQSNVSDDISPSSLNNLAAPSNNELQDILASRYSCSEEEDNVVVREHYSPDTSVAQSSSREIDGKSNEHECSTTADFVPTDCNSSFLCEESKSRKNLRFRRDLPQEQASSYWYEDRQDDSGGIGDIQQQSRERTRNTTRGYSTVFSTNNRTRDRYKPCSCGHQEDYRYFSTTARPSREMKMARKAVVEKLRLQYRRCYPLDSFIVSKGGRVGGTPNKNAGPKQVWEPMDTRKKASLGNGNNAAGTADDTNRSNQVECSKDINECQKPEKVCEPLAEVCSERSEEACRSDTDEPCKESEKNQPACNDGSHVVDKPDCCLTKDAGRMANLTSSDSSSCLSQGDRDSSMSSMTSLSAQNAESSSTSDSEESSERNNSNPGDPPTKNASRSLLEMCAGNGFREYQPKGIHPPDGHQFGFNVAPIQDQMLHHQKVHAPPYSSAFLGFHSHPLPVPTNGYIPYPQPAHFYPSSVAPVGYGVAGNQCVDFPMQYNNVHPYSGPEFSYVPSQPVHKAPVSFHAVPPTPLCRNGVPVIISPDMQQNHAFPPKLNQAVPKNGYSEDNTKQKDDDSTPFSLFQFNLPIAPPAPATSKEEQSRGALVSILPVAQPQPCSREETNIKEYNLFSGCKGVIFPFI